MLAGNHDLGLVTFLNLISTQGGDAPSGYAARRPEPPLWEEDVTGGDNEGNGEAVGAHVGMHLQGRRWGASARASTSTSTSASADVTTNAFESEATFASYGVAPGDRAGLLAAMPAAHKALLASLEFVVELDGVTDHQHPEVTRLVAVHAGLQSARPVREQLAALRARTVDRQWVVGGLCTR